MIINMQNVENPTYHRSDSSLSKIILSENVSILTVRITINFNKGLTSASSYMYSKKCMLARAAKCVHMLLRLIEI
jgi:hypothetical protein